MSVPDEPRHAYLLGGAWFNRLGEGGHIGCTIAEDDTGRISFGGECFLAGFVEDFDGTPVSPPGFSMDNSSPAIPRGFVDWEGRLRFFRVRQLILGGQMCSPAPQCPATGEGLSSGCFGDAGWDGIQRKLDDWGGQAFRTAWTDWWNANRSTWLAGDFGFSEFTEPETATYQNRIRRQQHIRLQILRRKSGGSNICTGGIDSNDCNSLPDSDESEKSQGCEGTEGKWETTRRKKRRVQEARTKDKAVQPKAVGSREVFAPLAPLATAFQTAFWTPTVLSLAPMPAWDHQLAPLAKAVQTAFLAPTVLSLASMVVPASATKSSKIFEDDDPRRKWEATHEPNLHCERGSFAHRDQEHFSVLKAASGGSPFVRTLAWMKSMRSLVFKTSSQSCPGWPGSNPIVPLLPSHLPSTPLCLTSYGKPLNRSRQRVQIWPEWLVASFNTRIFRSSGDLSMLKKGLGSWSITDFQEFAFGTLVDDLVLICRPANASTEAGRGTPLLEILRDTIIETAEDIPGGAQRTELLVKDSLGYVQNSAYSGYLTACHQDTPLSQGARTQREKLITAMDFAYLTKNTGSPFTGATSATRNGGNTKNSEHPNRGAVPLPRELVSNRQAELVAGLCWLVHEQGGGFSVENPTHAEAAKKASGSKPDSHNKKRGKLIARAPLPLESLPSFDAEESKVPLEASHIAGTPSQEGPPERPFLHPGASSSSDYWVSRDPYDAITTEDFMDRAAEQTFGSPQRSPGALTSAPVNNLCLHCEVSPGTDWPFGLLCDECHDNLSGVVFSRLEASLAPQAGNILSCGEVCDSGEACHDVHGTIQGTCTHTKGHDPAVAHMCKPCIDYYRPLDAPRNKSLSTSRRVM